MKGTYICSTNENETLSRVLIEANEIKFPDMFYDPHEMIKYARALKAFRKEAFLKFPFCVTLEAEALGAKINFDSSVREGITGPRVKSYAMTCKEDVFDFVHGDPCGYSDREKNILGIIKKVCKEEYVTLCVTGPLTIASSLMDQRLFYKLVKQNPGLMDSFLDKVTEHIIEYSRMGVRSGAKIISFADPVGGMDIIGPRTFERICLGPIEKILKALLNENFDGLIHLCPKTSKGLAQLGRLKSKIVEYEAHTYTKALIDHIKASKASKTSMVGHRCIQSQLFTPALIPGLETRRLNRVQIQVLEFREI